MPYGTDVTALVATFTTTGASVKVGSTVQVSGTTANDFNHPIIYTSDGGRPLDRKLCPVTVTVTSSSTKAITAFSFTSPPATGTIDKEDTKAQSR